MKSSEVAAVAASMLWTGACSSDDDAQTSSAAHAQRDGGTSTPRDAAKAGANAADKQKDPADVAARGGDKAADDAKGPGAAMTGHNVADGGVDRRPGVMHGPDKMPADRGHHAAGEGDPVIRTRPETFDFLGFTHIAGKSRRGQFQLQRRGARVDRALVDRARVDECWWTECWWTGRTRQIGQAR